MTQTLHTEVPAQTTRVYRLEKRYDHNGNIVSKKIGDFVGEVAAELSQTLVVFDTARNIETRIPREQLHCSFYIQ